MVFFVSKFYCKYNYSAQCHTTYATATNTGHQSQFFWWETDAISERFLRIIIHIYSWLSKRAFALCKTERQTNRLVSWIWLDEKGKNKGDNFYWDISVVNTTTYRKAAVIYEFLLCYEARCKHNFENMRCLSISVYKRKKMMSIQAKEMYNNNNSKYNK